MASFTRSRGVFVLLACLLASAACGSTRPPPPPIVPNTELDALEKVVEWGHPSPEALVFLATELLASGRNHEGRAFFARQAAAHPTTPAYRAVEGLFEAKTADDVFVLRRVAYVEGAVKKLDDAAASDPTPVSRFFRALVLAELPARFGRAADADRELRAMLAEDAPPTALRNHGTRRLLYRALAHAQRTLGRDRDAEATLARAQLPRDSGDLIVTTPFAVDRTQGTRYGARAFEQVADRVFVASNFDFSQMYFVITDSGVIAIDAGTTPERAKEAKLALRTRTNLPITHVIVTHAHWDHIGGLEAMREPDTQVIASAASRRQLEITNETQVPRDSYFGEGAQRALDLKADHWVERDESMTIDGLELRLRLLPGGETDDSMVVEVPARGVVFVGDVLASVGSPPGREGSPEHFIDALRALASYGDARLLHGHDGIDWVLPARALPVLARAFEAVAAEAQAAITAGQSLPRILRANILPDVLREDPDAVTGFLMYREMFLRRLHRQRTGPWSPDGDDIEVLSPAELGAAVDLVAGGNPARFDEASRRLLAQGDYALAAKIAELGLHAHPNDRALRGTLASARRKLLERNQVWDFFKVTEYSELSDTPIPAAP